MNLTKFTAEQKKAITHIDGPMLVVASAGSGKTAVVTNRIAYLLEKGIKPDNILALTFTNKAANEMKDRIKSLVGSAPKYMGTFHSICAKILRKHINKLNIEYKGFKINSNYSIIDADDQYDIISDIIEKLKINVEGKKALAEYVSHIDFMKCTRGECEDEGPFMCDRVSELYDRELIKLNSLDFNDLLNKTVDLFEARNDVLIEYQSIFKYILVDEYQDTSTTQYMLLHHLAKVHHNLHATGDPDQSIYSWRGANYSNIMDFKKDYPDANIVILEKNFRSTQKILDASNKLIKNNINRIDKELIAHRGDGNDIKIINPETSKDEAMFIGRCIKEHVAKGGKYNDIAILYRVNYLSRGFESALRQMGIPYIVKGGFAFYSRAEVKDYLAHLKVLANPDDYLSVKRIAKLQRMGVGDATLDKVYETKPADVPIFTYLASDEIMKGNHNASVYNFARWCKQLKKYYKESDLLKTATDILNQSRLLEHIKKYEKEPINKLENVGEVMTSIAGFLRYKPDATVTEYLADVTLMVDASKDTDERNAVQLATIHGVKGLEYNTVFVTAVEDGIFPSGRSNNIEEERRLFYVALTRGKDLVILTHVNKREVFTKMNNAKPSMFLKELIVAKPAIKNNAQLN